MSKGITPETMDLRAQTTPAGFSLEFPKRAGGADSKNLPPKKKNVDLAFVIFAMSNVAVPSNPEPATHRSVPFKLAAIFQAPA